jgi:hypothetical protein
MGRETGHGMTKPPQRALTSESASIEDGLYTVKQVAAMLPGYTEKAIRHRIKRGTLLVHQGRPHSRILISRNDLEAAGMLAVPLTREDRAIRRLITFLVTHPDETFTTHRLRSEAAWATKFAEATEDPSGTGEMIDPKVGRPGYHALARQTTETALSTLRVLGWVEKTTIPSGSGSGKPRTGWRWIGPPQAAATLAPL